MDMCLDTFCQLCGDTRPAVRRAKLQRTSKFQIKEEGGRRVMFWCQDNQGARVFQEGEGGESCMLPHQSLFAFPLSNLLRIPKLIHTKSLSNKV